MSLLVLRLYMSISAKTCELIACSR
uniref:Uncharacterized protein n=1 Tax=Arundo donax TaxID=35708 RepID=A0A0A8Y6S9_ARUDO